MTIVGGIVNLQFSASITVQTNAPLHLLGLHLSCLTDLHKPNQLDSTKENPRDKWRKEKLSSNNYSSSIFLQYTTYLVLIQYIAHFLFSFSSAVDVCIELVLNSIHLYCVLFWEWSIILVS